MQRFHQFLFIAVVLAFGWWAMMGRSRFGHVVGALCTGGNVERVVLYPVTISRTDVSPNPNPSVVVWLGPILGSILPVVAWLLLPRCLTLTRNIAMFFAVFCLLANGAYIAVGSIDHVGDSGVMLQNGSPLWSLISFGALTIPAGLFMWHRLGSIKQFLSDASIVDARIAYILFGLLLALLVCEFAFSPR